jgi:hypothetical protein
MSTRPAPSDGETGELTTPTGAALLTVLGRFVAQPPIDPIARIGYGFGTREPPWPNAVRVLVAEPGNNQHDLIHETIVEIQTNLDDATPEELGFAMERLLEAGALDVAFSPLQMKKNRPGVLLRVLGRVEDGERLAGLVLAHTSALGARVHTIERLIARRSARIVATPWGDVQVKIKHLGDRELVAPEYEDCARVARAANVPLRQVYDAARRGLAGRNLVGFAQDLLGFVDHARFVRIGQAAKRLANREPLHDVVFPVVVGGIATSHLHQVEVHGLEVAHAAPDEPVLDLIERLFDPHEQARLLADFAHGGAFEGFADLGRTFGQRPALRAQPPNQGHLDRPVLRRTAIDDAAGRYVAHEWPGRAGRGFALGALHRRTRDGHHGAPAAVGDHWALRGGARVRRPRAVAPEMSALEPSPPRHRTKP